MSTSGDVMKKHLDVPYKIDRVYIKPGTHETSILNGCSKYLIISSKVLYVSYEGHGLISLKLKHEYDPNNIFEKLREMQIWRRDHYSNQNTIIVESARTNKMYAFQRPGKGFVPDLFKAEYIDNHRYHIALVKENYP